jgi:hypothetical protein
VNMSKLFSNKVTNMQTHTQKTLVYDAILAAMMTWCVGFVKACKRND